MSSASTFDKPLRLPLTEADLDAINAHLSTISSEPQKVLAWGVEHLPNLYQTTAFGLTGLVAIDMLSKIAPGHAPPLIFLDTLYHFQETHDLVEEVKKRYGQTVHVFRPEGCETAQDFETKHGEKLWEANEEKYDYLVKAEPAQRAYRDLHVQSVITGRRASQGGDRASLQPLEVDATGMLKLNPLCAWTLADIEKYMGENNVPRNALYAQGYKSVGDWHSTQKSGAGDSGERAGRWADKADKTECGLHKDFFAMKKKAKMEAELAAQAQAQIPMAAPGAVSAT
ncbi:phosophoadenylyl-sulfate reductase [Coniophora puteana RWD-64-598 SS2]|uniref:Phosophoadenylyl-sulfate reductase n=1 Tax=Coniophora puteana (strain RWD-64-598) TaxID=741705 RepID=A0A5M3MC43_CONPW|nr:phosophoadenylyl-sulfate reductase [Coniophora puteana RWD-64-598 SS2]EIW76215.1 phosophoadenylyl-sulfate reductase [Coniophora puteana RWD-64-598 SS2]